MASPARALLVALGIALLAPAGAAAFEPHVVVATVDEGLNPYSPDFRDTSPLAYEHPSQYIAGYPASARVLPLSLDLPYDEAVKRDDALLKAVKSDKLYWIPGTKIVGLMSAGDTILDSFNSSSVGHGSMTASRSAGNTHSLAPGARLVRLAGLSGANVRWLADQGWVDVQSNSWLSLVPQQVAQQTTTDFAHAAKRMLTLAASGNGAAYSQGFAPTPTQTVSTAAQGVVLVGAHDNGHLTPWSGSPPHIVADGYAGWTALFKSREIKPDRVACCTSAASPYVAGGAGALIVEARRILGSYLTGSRNGVVARGLAGTVAAGPLADGVFTLAELKTLLFHTAEARPAAGRDDGILHWAGEPRAPEYVDQGPGANPFCRGCTTSTSKWSDVPSSVNAYQYLGYGAVNERSVALGVKVLRGQAPLPARPSEDSDYASDQAGRPAGPDPGPQAEPPPPPDAQPPPGSGGAGAPAEPTSGSSPGATSAPGMSTLRVTLLRRPLRRALRRGVRVRVTCRGCRDVVISLVAPAALARRHRLGRKPRVVAAATLRTVDGTAVATLRFTRAARARLAHARRLRLTLQVSAIESGRPRMLRRRAVLR